MWDPRLATRKARSHCVEARRESPHSIALGPEFLERRPDTVLEVQCKAIHLAMDGFHVKVRRG